MWKNIVERGRPQMTIRPMRTACWIPKATNTHTQVAKYLPFFHCNKGCTNANQCYVTRTLPDFFLFCRRFIFVILNQTSLLGPPNIWRPSASSSSHLRYPVTAVVSSSLSLWPHEVSYSFLWLQTAFKGRLTAFHLINAPAYVDPIVEFGKSLLKPKLAARVSITLRQISWRPPKHEVKGAIIQNTSLKSHVHRWNLAHSRKCSWL